MAPPPPSRPSLLPAAGTRVLFFGKSMSRTRCTGALVEGWRQNGATVRWVKMPCLRRRFGREGAKARARRIHGAFAPDLVFVFCRDLDLELIEEFRTHGPVVFWVEEALENLDEHQVAYFHSASLVCLSNPTRIPMLAEHGVDHTLFAMSGFSPRYHQSLGRRQPRRDLAFIGGPGRKGQRVAMLAEIAKDLQLEVFGEGWNAYKNRYPAIRVRRPVGNRGYAKVCATSRIVLGINEVNGDSGYFSNRTWLTLACAGFHLTHYVPGLERVFENGRHLAWFHDADEARAAIATYLASPDSRERIRSEGHALAQREHTYTHRIAAVLQHMCVGARVVRPELTGRVPMVLAGRMSPHPVRD